MSNTKFDVVARTEEVYLYGSQRRTMRGWRVFVMDLGRVVESSPFFVQYGDPKAAAAEVAKRDEWIAARS